VNVAAVMTAARYENVWARNTIERSLRALSIPLTVSGGVYYGQCMQMMLEAMVESGKVDYVVTVDGDTIFRPDQLQRLISIINQQDEIDAITGLQIRRGKPTLLGTIHGGVKTGEDEVKITYDGTPLRAKTAHFGLTVIDVKKLASVAKPWFVATPNADGRWEGDKIDDDVWFWLQWERAGNSVYIDPGTRLGHLEEMVVMHDEQLNPVHIYPKDWKESNDC
jgi:hypothetical protein